MDGNLYLPVKNVIQLTGLKKSQVYNLIKSKQIIAESEVIGAESRHKILVRSILLWLAVQNKIHQEKANHFKRSYDLLQRSVNRHA